MRVSITRLADRIAAVDAIATDNAACVACEDRADNGHEGVCISCIMEADSEELAAIMEAEYLQ